MGAHLWVSGWRAPTGRVHSEPILMGCPHTAPRSLALPGHEGPLCGGAGRQGLTALRVTGVRVADAREGGSHGVRHPGLHWGPAVARARLFSAPRSRPWRCGLPRPGAPVPPGRAAPSTGQSSGPSPHSSFFAASRRQHLPIRGVSADPSAPQLFPRRQGADACKLRLCSCSRSWLR